MPKPKTHKPHRPNPKRLHLDKRADELIAVPITATNAPGSVTADDDLLSTLQVAAWLGLSTQWLEIGRCRGYGPKFVRLGPRRVRYRRADVIEFLRERRFASTAEHAAAS